MIDRKWLKMINQMIIGICTVRIVPPYPATPEARAPSFFGGSQSCDPASWLAERQLLAGDIESNRGPKPFYTYSLNILIHQSNPLNPPHPHSPQSTHPHLSNPLGKIHPHTTEHLFNCTHLYTPSNILDIWMSPGWVVPLLGRWKGCLVGLPKFLGLSDPSTATRSRSGSTTTT